MAESVSWLLKIDWPIPPITAIPKEAPIWRIAALVPEAIPALSAETELIKQYDFMHRIFHNARRRIDSADDDDEKRRVLRILGDAALEEHSEWILMHRERSIDQKEILRLS